MMAARRLNGIRASQVACICVPHHPYPPVRAIQQRLDPGDAVMDQYRQFLGAEFQSDWSALETAAWIQITEAQAPITSCSFPGRY